MAAKLLTNERDALQTLLRTVASPEFLAGFRWGALAGIAGVAAGWWWRRNGRPAPLAGLAAVTAATWAMKPVRDPGLGFWLGLGALALGGVFWPLSRRLPVLRVVAAVPGTWLLTRGRLPDPSLAPWLIIVTVPLIAPLLARFEELTGETGVGAPLIGVSVAGAFLTLPDTEEVLVLLGALVVPVLLTWPTRWLNWGQSGAYAFAGMFLWTVAWGGRGRSTAVVGALAALGVTIAGPVAAWIAKRGWRHSPFRLWVVFGAQLLAVFLAARVAGLRSATWEAVALSVAVLVGAGAAWISANRRVDTRRQLP